MKKNYIKTRCLKMFAVVLFMYVVTINQSKATEYYINDNTIGEPGALCSAVGDDANPGTADLPKATLTSLRALLLPGDIVYIDLGSYNWGTPGYLGTSDGNGTADNPIKIIGVDSVNTIVKGTTNSAFYIDGANFSTTSAPVYWQFSSIKFSGVGQNALQVSGPKVSNMTFTACVFESTGKAAVETPAGPAGLVGGGFDNVSFINCRIQSNIGALNFTSSNVGITNMSFIGCTLNHTGANTTTALAIGNGIMNNFTFDKCIINSAGTGNIFNMPGGQYNDWKISNCKINGAGSGNALQLNGGSTYINFNAYNNFIYNTAIGINVIGAANASGMSFQHNSFYTTGTCFKADGGASGGTYVRNNIFYTTGEYCIEFLNAASPTTMDYNLYYHPNGKLAKRFGVDYATLADWKNVFNSNDANSIEGDPKYDDVSTGDLNITCSSPAFHAGLYVNIAKDINNQDRANPGPSIGASEGSGSAGSITIAQSETEVCAGTPVTLTASGASNYSWSPETGLDVTTGATVIATPDETTTYTVTGDNAGCPTSSTATITVKAGPVITFTPANPVICGTGSVTITASGADSYTWTPATGLNTTTGPEVIATITTTDVYTVTGTAANGCEASKEVTVTVASKPTVEVTADDASLCPGESTSLTASGAVTYTWFPDLGLDQATGETVVATPDESTTYDVIGTDANGCQNTATIDIIVNELPEVIANADNETICEGAEVILTGSGASSYTWDNGVTNGVAFSPAETNTYTVTGTDANGCTNTDEITVTVEVCSGIKKPSNTISLEVYPNPNTGKFTLQFDSKKSQIIEVIVYDSKGQIQYRGFENSTIGQVSKNLDLNLTEGIYQIQLISDDVNSTQKFVVN